MRARFLLGPAGSGKTFRCLAEIRDVLKQSPEGPPLIFLAPKQATFQLERQLLADDSLPGFTRLQILSFERLARFILDALNIAPPSLLSDEGRIMVLRALLLRHETELKLFRRSARRPGFADELAGILRELQQNKISSEKLHAIAQNKKLRPELREKLEDLALLQERYSQWLADNKLQDADCLLDYVTGFLKKDFRLPASGFRFAALYLDGFAEMTPQELDLLVAVLPFCESATLAFCLDESALAEKETSWLSIWNTIRQTYDQCRQRVETIPGAKIEIKKLPDRSGKTRFSKNQELAHLENSWPTASRSNPSPILHSPSSISIYSCSNPESESILAAREILKFVRAGNRFRDCAVLVRDLASYHKPLAQTFRRYGIPFFLDRRESIAHHALAELTRGVLRAMISDWDHDDFFAALKSGFCTAEETDIDALENAALEFGWRGQKWRESLSDESFERLRKKILPPFERVYSRLVKLDFKPSGQQLAEVFRRLWDDLDVEQTLEEWSAIEEKESAAGHWQASVHGGVFEQMNTLLKNLELGLGGESLSLRDWLPIIESGLAGLTVGIIPPVLDEVLVGAVDRARNPDLKLALVLGMNESVFPAVPASRVLLTDADREELEMPLGPDLREQAARERFYGYIACTRASEKLAVTFSRSAADGTTLNPSAFIGQLQRILPGLEIDELKNDIALDQIESIAEAVPLIFNTPVLDDIPGLTNLRQSLADLREPDPQENLTPSVAARIYGPTLRTSVSRLEEFAQCPFRFFVRSGLKAEERKVFELDARERGSFQHDILKQFHDGIIAGGKRWRDLTPQEARDRIGQIADGMIEHYRSGLLNETAQSRFAARVLTGALQDFVAVTVSWLREQNQFDPVASELAFGSKESPQTAWELALDDGRKLALTGRIDRVDLCRDANGDSLAIVLDYKSSQKKLEPLLVDHGIQLQLLAYLNVLRHWKDPRPVFGVDKLVPTGVFYVNLRGQFENGNSRDEVLDSNAESQRNAYQHKGRFDAAALKQLDGKRARDQFNYRLKNDGTLYAGLTEALPHAEFQNLLDRVEVQLRDFGNAIYAGRANVDPYQKGKDTACRYCDYAPACRIDPWTHKFRALK
ncbi:MAG TPA: PD-(D/E)XK nuclease family protein [Verrucomicrobiae bacterium]